jgi:hypothetical protein
MAWDAIGAKDPNLRVMLLAHLILLARHGIRSVEIIQRDELAAAGHYRLHSFCRPLKRGVATGSPARPLALVCRRSQSGR